MEFTARIFMKLLTDWQNYVHICHTEFHLNKWLEVRIHVGPWITLVVSDADFYETHMLYRFKCRFLILCGT